MEGTIQNVKFSDSWSTQLDRHRFDDAGGTVDVVRLAEIESEYVFDEPDASVGIDRTGRKGSWLAFLLGSASLVAGCSKKSEVSEEERRQKELVRQKQILQGYLRRQKIANVKKVNAIFLMEEVLNNPPLLGSLYSPRMIEVIRNYRGNAFTAVYFRLTTKPDGSNVFLRESPIYVLIRSRHVSLIKGTTAQRNTFDSILYHEIEGHATDYGRGSRHSKFVHKIIRIIKGDRRVFVVLGKVLDDVKELSAYLLELDRLIVKLDFDKNPAVVTPWLKSTIDKELVRCFKGLWKLFNSRTEDRMVNEIVDTIRDYCMGRINSVSPRTRTYLRGILKKHGWKKAIPFK